MIGNPTKIKDIPNKIESVRADFYEAESNKIIGKKGMVFKTFQTEKQRIVILFYYILYRMNIYQIYNVQKNIMTELKWNFQS